MVFMDSVDTSHLSPAHTLREALFERIFFNKYESPEFQEKFVLF